MMHIDGDLVVIAITVVTTVGMVALGPIGRALADRLRGRVASGALDAIEERLDEISGQVLSVQRQVGDIIERQEFSERLLARARDRGMLGSGT
jgi:hypothetical protein